VAGLDDPFLATDKPSGIPHSAARAVGPRSFGFSPELRKQIAAKLSSDSVLHVHGLWMYPGLAARRLACGRGVRVVISPHGMLEPWALNNSRWKKKLAGWVFENRNLHTADCLHALCAAEGESFRLYGLRNPIAVIPNGIDPTAFEHLPGQAVLETRFPALRNRRWILFLSRIHPKKGLPHLLRAWAAIQKSEWALVIAGPDELGHEAQMKCLAAELGIESSVLFTGPLQGDERLAALGNAELFVLPSFSEGFSMAVLEAAAAGLPVLLTPQCNFPELAKADAAIEVSPDAAGCEAGLRRLLALSEAERQAMGQRGRSLVTSAYTWRCIAAQMLAVYRWLLQGGSPPACIRLD
jgi:glycosyltransferase involved in cell wall biosynthesis